MEPAGQDLLAAVLASLPAHTAVLDPDGCVLVVNDAWRRFCTDNGGRDDGCGPGASYLAVCEATEGEMREEALEAAAGVRRVLAGEAASFSMDYECSSPEEERWFQMTVVPLRGAGDAAGAPRGAVVSHGDITTRKRDQAALLHEATHDPLTGLLNRSVLLAELRRELHRAQSTAARCPCSTWTWTGSRRSTTPSATARATTCCGPPPGVCATSCAPATTWPGWGATSSSPCSPAPEPQRPGAWRSGSPRPRGDRSSWTGCPSR
jgi:hypothetical protein